MKKLKLVIFLTSVLYANFTFGLTCQALLSSDNNTHFQFDGNNEVYFKDKDDQQDLHLAQLVAKKNVFQLTLRTEWNSNLPKVIGRLIIFPYRDWHWQTGIGETPTLFDSEVASAASSSTTEIDVIIPVHLNELPEVKEVIIKCL